MVDKKSRPTSEHEQLLNQHKIESEIPLAASRDSRGSKKTSNFKETNLLVVDKKKKFTKPSKSTDMAATDEEGVLSIPPEDSPNNCKSKSQK